MAGRASSQALEAKELEDVGREAVRSFWDRLDESCCTPLAAMETLLEAIHRSDATTMMRLQRELGAARDAMWESCVDVTPETFARLGQRSPVALRSGLELFERYVTRVSDEFEAATDFAACKAQLERNGAQFLENMRAARTAISSLGASFVRDGATVLTHGHSGVVAALLARARRSGRQFSVLVTESQPLRSGLRMAEALEAEDIPVTVIADTAVACTMERVDVVLVGAEAVVESGGIVNLTGTASIAINAKALSRPFYVAAESYKFARLYPLGQGDLPAYCTFQVSSLQRGDNQEGPEGSAMKASEARAVESPACDYTSGEYITLLFTDVGVRTPAAISDELISFYQ